ncbi:hypothetical protein TRVA0_015S01178 [Trichomonascus vanleenenianus]|uniref:uncharacterized protein n=1 Tax=Trichomonascus vanleenenianus TaxID=2268995 RepID=UPI003ECB477C
MKEGAVYLFVKDIIKLILAPPPEKEEEKRFFPLGVEAINTLILSFLFSNYPRINKWLPRPIRINVFNSSDAGTPESPNLLFCACPSKSILRPPFQPIAALLVTDFGPIFKDELHPRMLPSSFTAGDFYLDETTFPYPLPLDTNKIAINQLLDLARATCDQNRLSSVVLTNHVAWCFFNLVPQGKGKYAFHVQWCVSNVNSSTLMHFFEIFIKLSYKHRDVRPPYRHLHPTPLKQIIPI